MPDESLIAAGRYGLTPETLADAQALAAADAQAAEAGDTAFLLARIAALQARLGEQGEGADNDDVSWMGPQERHSPPEALRRIKTLCAIFPDLYGAMLAVQLTHAAVSRELLALAIKQFRRDAESLSPEDLQGLLTAALNGGRQGFDAVLRTRKGGERKSVSIPWGSNGE
jgi:hypothetical protein